MFKEISSVFGQSVIYGLTGITSTLISVFLVPIYTRILTPADYGIISLVTVFNSIVSTIAVLGMGGALFWAYFQAKKEEKGEVVSTSFIFQTIFPGILAILIFIFSEPISKAILGEGANSLYLKLSAGTIFFTSGIVIPLSILRVENSPRKYVIVTIANLVATLIFSILFVVILRIGVLGVFLAYFFGSLTAYLLGLAVVLKGIKLSFSWAWLREMLTYGVPLMPSGLAIWVLNSSDRYFLNAFTSSADVGIYNVGYRIGMIVALITGALQIAYVRFIFYIFHEKSNPQDYFRKITTYFFLVAFVAALGLSIFAKEAVQIITGAAFHSSYIVVPIIAFAYVIQGLYKNFGTGVSVYKKTYYSAIATIITAVFNLALNFFLISKFGVMGAAVSTIISFAFLAGLELYFSHRIYPISFEYTKMAKIGIIGILYVFVSQFINFNIIVSLILKGILFLSFLPFLYYLGLFEKRETDKLKVIFKQMKSSPRNVSSLVKILRGNMENG